MDEASSKGLARLLDHYLSNRERPCEYTDKSIDSASANGHVSVLEWWRNSGLELMWSEDAFDEACPTRNIGVLTWWKSSGLELKPLPMDLASEEGHVDVLEWWKQIVLDEIVEREADDDVERLWAPWEHGLVLKYGAAIELARSGGRVDVLEWWKNSGLKLKTYRALDLASRHGELKGLDWWLESGLELEWSDRGSSGGAGLVEEQRT
ncbi:hypothetical protein BJ742DRAFT_870416 [Cladochytrium replicatum]|nr:hypothetical protein BJ742DRAFT_870416 [Cladochytrium replicatum]